MPFRRFHYSLLVAAALALALPAIAADEPVAEYYETYSGSVPPLRLSNPLTREAAEARRDAPYYIAYRNQQGKPERVVKMVQGKIQLEDRYKYSDSGLLRRRETHEDGNVVVLLYGPTGDLERSFTRPGP